MSEEPPREGLYGFSVRRPVAVSMLVLSVIVFGFVSFGKLRLNLLPEISYPSVTIRTEYPGAAPEDVEERVSRRIQESLATIGHLVRIGSVSRAEVSDVTLEFNWGTQIPFAIQDVREKLDRVVLPNDAKRPIILRYDPNLDPVLRIGVSSKERDLKSLRKICEDEIRRDLETVEGVAAVRVRGGVEEEIQIGLDPGKLAKLNLDPELVLRRLREENLNAAGGKLEEGDNEYIVRTLNEFRSIAEIENIVVLARGDQRIYLKDIALIERGSKEREVVTRINGDEAVMIDIHREADANIVTLAGLIKTRLFGREQQQEFLKKHPEYVQARNEGRKPDFSAPEKTPEEKKLEKTEETKKEEETDPKKKEEAEKQALREQLQQERGRRLEYEKHTAFLSWKLPADFSVSVLSDQSRFIQESIDDVYSSAFIGGVLAILVIYLFLRQLAGTVIISLSIPISIIATFAVMYLFKVSINVMSLGGLALGIGMIVDDSIVVLESISRCREEGDSIIQAAIRGTREVGGAVISTTLTTVAVFFPLLFVEGISGQMFGDQALTVVTSLMVSLIVSLTFIPMLASRGKKENIAAESSPKLGEGLRFGSWKHFIPSVLQFIGRVLLLILSWLTKAIVWVCKALYKLFQWVTWPVHYVFEKGYNSLANSYPRILQWSIAHPYSVVLSSLLLLGVSIWRLPHLGSELLPEVHQGEFTAEVALAVGTPIAETDELLGELQKQIQSFPNVASTICVSGVEKTVVSTSEEGDHTAKLTIRLDEGPKLAEREEKVLGQVRDLLSSRPEIRTVRFRKPTLFSFSLPIEIEVKGRDLATIATLSREVEKTLTEIPGLTDIRSSLRRGNPEVQVRFDREKMIGYKLDTGNVSNLLRTSVLGSVPTAYVEGEDRIDIRVKAEEASTQGLHNLREMVVNPGSGLPIPLKSVATLDVREGPAEIRRIGNYRAAVITASSSGLDLGRTADKIEERLAGIAKPPGYEVVLGGQKQEMDQSLASMRFAVYLSIFLVFIVMAAQFESVIQPLIIMLTVPLSVIGVIFIMELTSTPISVISLIGVVILVGVVVDNATILLDRVNQRRLAGDSLDTAILEAGVVRLRPILMTAFSTLLGLLPLTGWLGEIPWLGAPGAGEGFELRAPMAVTVIGGMISATILTLVVIPVCYHIIENWKSRYVGSRAE